MMGILLVTSAGVLLLVGTWVGGWLLAWPLWLKLVLTALVVILVAAWFLGRFLLNRVRGSALERDIMKQAEDQVANARPDRRAEIAQLQFQMKRGIDALKASKLGNKAGGALYTLPWYLVIGPPGAGKSTALKHSGLAFPFLDPERGGVRGVGGTRNCDWWFTNEGIVLDTAGRYSTESTESDEWSAFLGFLKKYRPKKPINGIIVALSITDLVDATEEQIEAQATKLRQRMDEVTTKLKLIVPVYVMFTKADLVAGFSQFWNDLRKSDRAQMYGMTFPFKRPADFDPTKAFETEFDELIESVHARAIERVGAERELAVREAIFHYPLELYALKHKLADFVGALFRPNAFQETPTVRGVYFTSGTREGQPLQRVVAGMLRAFNIGNVPVPELQRDAENKSYFVTDLFRKVVFPDHENAGFTTAELRRQLLQRIAFAAITVMLGAVLVLPAGCSFIRNRDLSKETQNTGVAGEQINWGDATSSPTERVKRLDPVLTHLEKLEKWDADGAPIDYRWWMYTGDRLLPGLRNAYIATMQVGFASPTKLRIEDELKSIDGSAALTTEQYNVYFLRLKAYLQACNQDRLDVDWESVAMSDGWGRVFAPQGRVERDAIKPHVGKYFAMMKAGQVPVWTCDANLVGRVRGRLKRVSAEDRDFSALLRDANEFAPPITRESIFLNTLFASFVTSKGKPDGRPDVFVPGAYTRVGWESWVRDRLGKDRIKQLAGDRWVLGETDVVSVERTEKQLNELRDRYFSNYTRAWADFLKDFDVRRPNNNDEALEELSALSELPWPYQRLLRTLGDNVKLEEATGEKVATALTAEAERQALERVKAAAGTTGQILTDAGVLPAGIVQPKRWISPPEAAFEPMVKFGIAPDAPPVAAGQTPPPAAATQLAHYQNVIVSKLVAVLSDLRDSKGKGVQAKQVTASFQDAIRGSNELLNPTQSGFTRPILSPLLLNPIELSYAGVLNDLGGKAGGDWEADVWQKWHSQLEGGYPFGDTWRDVKMSDYTDFFKPGGLLFAFYDGNLQESLEHNGKKFSPTTRFRHSINFSSPFIKCFERGLEISEATFPVGAKTADAPLAEFETNLHSVSDDVSEVTFEIDGVSRTYKNHPEEWIKVQWPAKAGATSSSVRIRGFSGLDEQITRPGEWGFFRVLDAAKSVTTGVEGGRAGGRPTIVATWNFRTQGNSFVKMDIRPLREQNPFTAYLTKKERLFRGYNCPRVMSNGVR